LICVEDFVVIFHVLPLLLPPPPPIFIVLEEDEELPEDVDAR
jgi:hypothetical protein